MQNVPSVEDYAQAVDAGQLATRRGLALSNEDRLHRAVIEHIMCELAVDAGATCRFSGLPDDLREESLRARYSAGV